MTASIPRRPPSNYWLGLTLLTVRLAEMGWGSGWYGYRGLSKSLENLNIQSKDRVTRAYTCGRGANCRHLVWQLALPTNKRRAASGLNSTGSKHCLLCPQQAKWVTRADWAKGKWGLATRVGYASPIQETPLECLVPTTWQGLPFWEPQDLFHTRCSWFP